jgi:glycosyltransferase involved in cell wall biosynthesis
MENKINKKETVFNKKDLQLKEILKKSNSQQPLISIITVVYNGEKYLENTILSVINQTYNNIEYIIIDGGSTDHTIDIIKKYENDIHFWISEKDDGIYDAMNKGLKLCTGEIIGIINSDDYYSDESIFSRLIETMIEKPGDIYYGDMIIINQQNHEVIEKRYTNLKKLYFGMYLNHPSTFVKRSIYNKLGLFDSKNFKIAADYDFMFRNFINKSKFVYINQFMVYMRDGGESIKNFSLTKLETKLVRKKNLNYFLYVITNFIKFLKSITK